MQNIKTLIIDLKQALGFSSEEPTQAEPTETVEVKFTDVKSGDLTLRIDGDLMVGASVAIVSQDAEGNEVLDAAPDAEYIIEDGRTLVITNSAISDIIEAGVPEQEMTVAETETKTEENNFSEIKEITDLVKESFKNQSDVIQLMKNELLALKNDLEEVKKQPATTPIKMSKSEQVKYDINTEKDNHFNELVKIIKNK